MNEKRDSPKLVDTAVTENRIAQCFGTASNFSGKSLVFFSLDYIQKSRVFRHVAWFWLFVKTFASKVVTKNW